MPSDVRFSVFLATIDFGDLTRWEQRLYVAAMRYGAEA